ncbi:MAG: STM3941 family protein, partial [Oscillospiraceae bacterium]
MKKLSKKTIQYTAENGKMLLYLAAIMELAAGVCALAYGIIRYNGWMMAVGLLLNSISMFSVIFTRLAPKGEKIIVVTENRFYLSSYAGLSVNKHDFSWIDKVELLESRQKKTLIIYTNDVLLNSESHGFERRFVEKNLKLYGAPIAISDSELLKIGVSSVDLEELCETINANQIMEKIADF